eukprot:scaffold59238_cov27-Tisochrysis_lutea.AAC.7
MPSADVSEPPVEPTLQTAAPHPGEGARAQLPQGHAIGPGAQAHRQPTVGKVGHRPAVLLALHGQLRPVVEGVAQLSPRETRAVARCGADRLGHKEPPCPCARDRPMLCPAELRSDEVGLRNEAVPRVEGVARGA